MGYSNFCRILVILSLVIRSTLSTQTEKIHIKPEEGPVFFPENQPIEIRCQSSTAPEFRKDGQIIHGFGFELFSQILNHTIYEIEITKAEALLSDSGDYQCISTYSGAESDVITVVVYRKTVAIVQQNETIQQGDPLNITCIVTEEPGYNASEPKLEKDGIALNNLGFDISSNVSQNLTKLYTYATKTTAVKNDTGVYQCISARRGVDRSTFNITVTESAEENNNNTTENDSSIGLILGCVLGPLGLVMIVVVVILIKKRCQADEGSTAQAEGLPLNKAGANGPDAPQTSADEQSTVQADDQSSPLNKDGANGPDVPQTSADE